MSSSVLAEIFTRLEADERHLSGVLTYDVGIPTTHGNALLGVDPHGRRHLYVPVGPDDVVPDDRRSKGLVLIEDALADTQSVRRYADLGCTDAALHTSFTRLIEDAVQRLTTTSTDAVGVLRSTLGEWRELFRTVGSRLSESGLLGLIGELEILARLDLPDPLHHWVGPLGAVFDFKRDGVALEVKTTAGLKDSIITVSSLDQLDPTDGRLYLAVVSLRPDEQGPSLEDRIEALVDQKIPRDQLLQRIESLGYSREADQARGRYRLQRLRVWFVDSRFPGMRRSEQPVPRLKGIDSLEYTLLLDAAPPPLEPTLADRVITELEPHDQRSTP